MNAEEVELKFKELQQKMKVDFGRTPGIDALLFLIGVNELGQGNREFSREEKMDLLHVAHCKIFSLSGYYELERIDEQGWPHYKVVKQYPVMDIVRQESFLKEHILSYFDSLG